MKSYLKQDKVAPLTPKQIISFELDFNVKLPLLCILQSPSDLKSTIN